VRIFEMGYSSAIVVTRGYSVAVMKEEQYLYLFDSHSRDVTGRVKPEGAACLLRYECNYDMKLRYNP
jgi:hypothetical protein